MDDFQKKLDILLASLGDERPTLLLHSCCAPCSSYVIEYLAKSFEMTVFYSNPNIYPDEEFKRRANEQKRLIESGVLGEVDYVEDVCAEAVFLDAVTGHECDAEGGERCFVCFSLRLSRTADYAAKHGFDYFATTLTVSPHKNADAVNRAGRLAAAQFGARYIESDFKKKNGYLRSLELSKKYSLYRQNYCGCRFSFEGAKRKTEN